MPVYQAQCSICDKKHEYYSSVLDCSVSMPFCCEQQTDKKIFSAPSMMQDIQPYQSMVTGETIASRSHHRQHLREHKLIEIGNEKVEPRKIDESEKKKQHYETRKVIYDKLTALERA